MRYIQAVDSVFFRHIVDNGEPVLFNENFNVRPSKLTPVESASLEVFKLNLVTAPPYNPLTQTRIDADAVLINGRWMQSWIVENMSDELINAKKADQAALTRQTRNDKLKNSDWTQLVDSSADKATWAIYRQALRDISEQTGFPSAIVWPEQP